VLEALRSSELYAPHLLQHVREDKVVNDLVEGLMTVSVHGYELFNLRLGNVEGGSAAFARKIMALSVSGGSPAPFSGSSA